MVFEDHCDQTPFLLIVPGISIVIIFSDFEGFHRMIGGLQMFQISTLANCNHHAKSVIVMFLLMLEMWFTLSITICLSMPYKTVKSRNMYGRMLKEHIVALQPSGCEAKAYTSFVLYLKIFLYFFLYKSCFE